MSMLPEVSVAAWPSIGKFRFWLKSGAAHRPRTFVYHYGFLARDRGQLVPVETPSTLGGVKWVSCPEVEELGAAAWSAYERGEVVLAQRRRGDMWYEYLAIRRA